MKDEGHDNIAESNVSTCKTVWLHGMLLDPRAAVALCTARLRAQLVASTETGFKSIDDIANEMAHALAM